MDVFISYKKERAPHAERLASILEAYGYEVWWDYDLITGLDFRRQIETKLDEAKCVIVLWCGKSIESKFVRAEADRSERRNVLLQVYLEDLSAPLGFGETQGFSLELWKGEATGERINHLIDAVERFVGPKRPRPNLLRLFSIAPPISMIPTSQVPTGIAATDAQAAENKQLVQRGRGEERTESQKYKLNEVFRVGRAGVTEVFRNTAAIQTIRRKLKSPGRIVFLVGATKSGKTTLCHQTFDHEHPIFVHGQDIGSKADFFELLRDELGVDPKAPETRVRAACIAENRPIIIDDFHHIGGNRGKPVRKAILNSLKPFVDHSDLTIVVITLSDDLIAPFFPDIDDSTGRILTAETPPWSQRELMALIERGFDALNIRFDPSVTNHLIRSCYGNPLLMQVFCAEICDAAGIYETQGNFIDGIKIDDDVLRAAMIEPVRDFDGMLKRVRRKRGDKLYKLQFGNEATAIELVMLGMANVQIVQQIGMTKLKENCQSYMLTPNQLNQPITKRAAEELIVRLGKLKNSNMTATLSDGYLYVLHPFFKLYLRAVLAPSLKIELSK